MLAYTTQTRAQDGYPKAMIPQSVWNHDNSFCVGSHVPAGYEPQLLDTQKYDSVSAALVALNAGRLRCQSFCFVFSHSKNAYYLLWPSGKTQKEVDEFTESLSFSTNWNGMESKDEKLNFNGVQRRDACSTDSTSEQTKVDAGHLSIADDSKSSKEEAVQSRAQGCKSPRALSPSCSKPVRLVKLGDKTAVAQLSRSSATGKEKSLALTPALSSQMQASKAPSNLHQEGVVDDKCSSTVERSILELLASSDEAAKQMLPAMMMDTHKAERKALPPRIVKVDSAVKTLLKKDANKPVAKAASVTAPPKKVTEPSAFVRPAMGRSSTALPISTTISVTPLSKKDTEPSAQVRSASSSSSTSLPSSTSPTSQARGSSSLASSFSAMEGDADTTATGTKEIALALADIRTMTIEDLSLDQNDFDPSRPQLKAKLLEKLGLENAVFDKLDSDNSGCFNDGIWIVSDATSIGLVLKLVPHNRSERKTDREKFIELQQRCPNILTEFSLTFPFKILQLKEPSGAISKDLIVMRKAMGMQMTQHLFDKFQRGRAPELLSIFKEFGKFIKSIHSTYRLNNRSMQHGDCQPSNVFYDEVSRVFTLVDVADFGFGPYLAQGGEDDVQHFVDGLRTLTPWYGKSLIEDCASFFQIGYSIDRLARPLSYD